MAKYQIYVFCNNCGKTHPMPVAVNIDDGPTEKDSIGNVYKGKEFPTEIANLINNTICCPETNISFIQENNNQIFIVPVT